MAANRIERAGRIISVVFWIAAAALVFVCVIGIAVMFLVSSDDFTPMPFEANQWQQTPAEFSHASVRLRMADDFLASTSPVGKTRQQIVALLGEPDETTYFKDYDMVYQLGPERSFFAIDSEWLVLRLNEASIVTAAALARD